MKSLIWTPGYNLFILKSGDYEMVADCHLVCTYLGVARYVSNHGYSPMPAYATEHRKTYYGVSMHRAAASMQVIFSGFAMHPPAE